MHKKIALCIAAAGLALSIRAAEYPTVTMKEKPASFFLLMPQAGVTHLLTEDDLHNAIWDMEVSPEGRVFFGACGETFGSVYARMYEFLPDEKRLVRHFDLEKRLALDDIGLRTSKFHTSMSFLGDHKLLTTTHTTSPSPRHPVWMPYEYYNHKFEGFKGSDLLIWDYETNETKGLGKFTSHDTIYGATYDPKTGDYFGISCLLGRGYVYNLKDGSVRRLGQVTDSRASKTFLCSDGHIYGSTFSGAMFRYNTDRRDIEYLGLHVNGLLRQAHEWNGVLYFFTGTCGRPGCGMDFYAYDLKAGTLKNLGCPVPIADRLPQYRPDELPQYHAYGMTMDGEGRLWYGCHTVTPTIRYPGVKLYMWDFLRGRKPVDCGFLGTKIRTVSELADMRWLEKRNMLVITDGNHNSDKDDACGIIAIELDKFLPALADPSVPRLFSHDYTNYLPYPPSCWKYYPKDDWDACYARYLKYYRDVTLRFRNFAAENSFRIPSARTSGVSVWERTGRTSSAVKVIRWTSSTAFSFWTSGVRTFRTDCMLDADGKVVEQSFGADALPEFNPLQAQVDAKAIFPSVPGRQYLAEATASVKLNDGSVLVGTKDGMLARIAGRKVRAEGNAMTSGPVLMLDKSCDGSVWGVSAHDEGLGYVFRWTLEGGLELKGVPPDVKVPNGRLIHIYQPSAIAVSPDGRFVAVGGRDEIAGVVVFPVPVSHPAAVPDLPKAIPAWESVYAALHRADSGADDLWRACKTRADCDAHRARMREAMRKSIGPFPQRTPLKARVTGRAACRGCTVEKILFESRPGFYVTAVLYLPDSSRFPAPYPAALFVCGHSRLGKNAPWYRRACLKAADAGIAVLAVDPVAQGERIQRPEDAGVRQTWIHSHLSTAAALVGGSFAECEIWDNMRALDYLETRPDIRNGGFGCFGNSGGGTQSIYMSALDPRVKATASSCFMTTLRAQAYGRGLADGEQILFGQLASGVTHAGYELMGTGTVLHCARRGDMVPFTGVLDTVRLVRDVAISTREPDRYAFFSAAGPHGYCESTIEASVRWLRRHLRGETVSLEPGGLERLDEGFSLPVADAGDAWTVTDTGRVCDLPGMTNAYEYIERDLDAALARRRSMPAAELTLLVRRMADIREDRCIGLKTLSETNEAGFARRDLSLAISDGFAISVVERVPSTVKAGPVLLVSDVDQACFTDEAERLVADGHVVLTANLMGVGREGMSKHNLLGNENLDEELAKMLYLLGQSLVGRRAEQIAVLARHLAARGEGVPRIVTEGRIAVAAAHAKAVAPESIGRLECRREPCSWEMAIRTRTFVNYAELVNGALAYYDWIDLKGN